MRTASMKCALLPDPVLNTDMFVCMVQHVDEMACFLGQGARRV